MTSYLFGDWESWTKPVQVTDYKNTLPEKILFYLFKYSDGTYGAIMPLAGASYISTLGSQKNRFGARSVSYKDNYDANNVPLMAIALFMPQSVAKLPQVLINFILASSQFIAQLYNSFQTFNNYQKFILFRIIKIWLSF